MFKVIGNTAIVIAILIYVPSLLKGNIDRAYAEPYALAYSEGSVDWSIVAADVMPSVVPLQVTPSRRFGPRASYFTCTGWYIAPHLIVTAYHCAGRYPFELQGQMAHTRILWGNARDDIAILMTTARGDPFKLAESIRIGQMAIVASYQETDYTVSPVMVSRFIGMTGLDGSGKIKLTELTGHLRPGQSGSPVVDSEGNVIGMAIMTGIPGTIKAGISGAVSLDALMAMVGFIFQD